MIKKFLLFFCVFIVVDNAISQAEYNITKTVRKSFVDDILNSIDTSLYYYDSQERLILVLEESVVTRTEYYYENNIITIDKYFNNKLHSRLVKELNVDGFSIIETNFKYTNNEFKVTGVDSTFRNPMNQLIRSIDYLDYGSGLERINERFILYTVDGNIKNEERLLFDNNEIIIDIKETYDYDIDGTLERLILRTEQVIEDYDYSDTTYYYYDNDELSSRLKINYGAGGFYACNLVEIETVGDFRSELKSAAYDLGCNNYVLENKSEFTQNDNIYLNFENYSNYDYDEEDEIFVLNRSINSVQSGTLGDANISVASVVIHYENGEEDSRSEIEKTYMKSGLVVNLKNSIKAELLLFPNTTSQNNTINYEIVGVEYNNIKIVDFTGQTILHEPVVDKRNLFFTAPTTSGMYFVQLLNGKVPVTKPAKLIVK